MSDFPLLGVGSAESVGANTAGSAGTNISVGSPANTKGNWTQLIASTARRASWLMVSLGLPSTTNRFLVDIGVGANPNETVIVPNLPNQPRSTTAYMVSSCLFPVAIPAGTRISARAQNNSTSGVVRVSAQVFGETFAGGPGSAQVDGYGPDLTDSGLTSIDPGTVAHTKGSWVPLTTSSTRAMRWMVVGVGGDLATRAANQSWLVDIGVGSPETILVENLFFISDSNNDIPVPGFVTFPVPRIPAGTRISARCQCSVTTATERLLDIAVWGVG